MSWESYITNRLMNFYQFGHVYNNVLTDAIIIDFKGKILATTGISINYEESQKLKEFFEQIINTILYLKLGEKKYRILHYEKDKHAYIRDGEKGGTIAKAKNLYVIGFFDTKKIYTYDGEKKIQCPGICNTVVEELANELKSQGF